MKIDENKRRKKYKKQFIMSKSKLHGVINTIEAIKANNYIIDSDLEYKYMK